MPLMRRRRSVAWKRRSWRWPPFLGGQAVTRAEAVVVILRVLDLVDYGIDPTLKLTVDGKLWTGLPLAKKGDVVYAPASAVYGLLADTDLMSGWDRLGIFPGNGVFRFSLPRIQIEAGAPFAYVSRNGSENHDDEMQKLPMLAPTYMRKGEMMLPVASTYKDGCLPYATGHLDEESATVHLTIAPEWPGDKLPSTLSEARLRFRYPVPTLSPGNTTPADRPTLEDQAGNWIQRDERLPVTLSVDPTSPLRLLKVTGEETGSPVTELGPGISAKCIVPVTGPDVLVPEGQFGITATAPGMAPATIMVTVEDHRPCKFSVEVMPAQGGKDEYVVEVTYLDNRRRVVDFSHQYSWVGYRGPSLKVVVPDGSVISAKPILVPDNLAGVPRLHAGWDFIVIHGISRFTFPYAGSGKYRIVATSPMPPFPWCDWGDILTEIHTEVEVALPKP